MSSRLQTWQMVSRVIERIKKKKNPDVTVEVQPMIVLDSWSNHGWPGINVVYRRKNFSFRKTEEYLEHTSNKIIEQIITCMGCLYLKKEGVMSFNTQSFTPGHTTLSLPALPPALPSLPTLLPTSITSFCFALFCFVL